jgi:tRNA A37 threonylcarbamoyladenosine dehydratase
MNPFARLELLIGEKALSRLRDTTVAVIGLGGVGGICAETLARCGVGRLIVQDYDVVEVSNINRQIIADMESIGRKKAEICAERIRKINPECAVEALALPFGKDSDLFSRHIDYLADAIDDLENKYLLIRECLERKISFVSAMGMARKLDWRKIAVMKLAETSYDPLARMLRRRLRDDGLSLDFPVVSSTEKPLPTAGLGSYMPVTSIAGIVMADHIIKKVISETTEEICS